LDGLTDHMGLGKRIQVSTVTLAAIALAGQLAFDGPISRVDAQTPPPWRSFPSAAPPTPAPEVTPAQATPAQVAPPSSSAAPWATAPATPVAPFAAPASPPAAAPAAIAAPAAQVAPPPAPATSGAPARALNIRYSQQDGFDRAIVDWPEDVDFRVDQQGRNATITFGAPVGIDTARLQQSLRNTVSSARVSRDGDRTSLTLAMNENVGLRHLRAGPRLVLDFVRDGSVAADRPTGQQMQLPQQAAQPGGQSPAQTPGGANVAPVTPGAPVTGASRNAVADFPALAQQAQALGLNQPSTPAGNLSGRVTVEVQREENFSVLRFGFGEPVGAAVFGRGANLWIAFDKRAAIDLAPLRADPETRDLVGDVDQLQSDGTVLRMTPRGGANALVRRDGTAWVVELGRLPRRPETPLSIVIRNPDQPADARVAIELPGASSVLRLRDPEIGDELAIVPTAVAGVGLAEMRRFAQFQILASAQGAVVRPDDDSVSVRPLGTGVEVASTRGLFVTAPTAPGMPGAAQLRNAALIDYTGWARQPGKYNEDRAQLRRAVANAREGDPRNAARLDLARFLFANALFQEANAELRLIGEERPQLLDGPQIRLMRGVAELFSGNLDEAARWLNHSSLDTEAEGALWRGALAIAQSDPQAAIMQFDRAADVSERFPRFFANKLGLAMTEARIAAGEFDPAERRLDRVLANQPSTGDKARADYLKGRIALERGDERAALAAWQELDFGTVTKARVQAELARIEVQSRKGELSPEETVASLERLRFAWRGDELEFDIQRRLGRAQLASGDFRGGTATLRDAAQRFPEARGRDQLAGDISGEFKKLFLEGGADKLSPVSAIGLFEDYRDLVPSGPEGDEMVRKLAERMVAVDLLDRAATLLDHQMRNRVSGEMRAQVGTRLAAIRLLDRKPQLALDAIDASEPAQAPELQRERSRLAARALADLGKPDEALARLNGDTGADADLLRAEIALRTRAWPAAAQALERLVGEPPGGNTQIADNRARQALHWAVALALSGDEAGTTRLRDRFGAAMGRSPYAEVFRVLTADRAGATPDIASIAARVSSLAPFESFMQGYRQRLAGPQAARPAAS
jgi:tetratricopeptide (TPR) repeat protein